MQNFFEKSLVEKNSMKHVIFTKTDFLGSFIQPRSSIQCFRKTDDAMSYDVIIDYIIKKIGKWRYWFTYLHLRDDIKVGFDDLK